MSAAARAASVAPSTAMPASACLSAGASFTPSPVMPTTWPTRLQRLDDRGTCARGTPARTRRPARCRAPTSSSGVPSSRVASRMSVPSPTSAAISRAMAGLVAGDHLHRHAQLAGRPIVARESSRGGSARGRTPTRLQRGADPGSALVGAGDGQRARHRGPRSPRPPARPWPRPPGCARRRDPAGPGSPGAPPCSPAPRRRRTTGRWPRCACAPGRTAGTPRPWHRPGPERACRGQHRLVDHVTGAGPGRQPRPPHHVVGVEAPSAADGPTDLEAVLGERAGLVGAQDVHAADLLHRGEVADHGVLAGQLRRADGHRHRQHGGQRHRDRGDRPPPARTRPARPSGCPAGPRPPGSTPTSTSASTIR